jgi:hypothetical protein
MRKAALRLVFLATFLAGQPCVWAAESDTVPVGASAATAIEVPGSRAPNSISKESPTPDRSLEKRLVRTSYYETMPGDTLQRVAYLLYGHRSWWSKIKKQNPAFKKYRPDAPLPVGKTIKYRAPKIGENYTVRKNDWLIRIAQWKYGSSVYWRQLYSKNSNKIENPDLIHPGDRLVLRLDGTIENTKTGQVIVQGMGGGLAVVQPTPPGTGLQPGQPGYNPALHSGAVSRGPASAGAADFEIPWWEDQSRLSLIATGFLLGLLALLWVHHRQSGMWAKRVSARAAARRMRTSIEEDEEEVNEEEIFKRAKARSHYTGGFKRRPLDEYQIDPNMLPRDEGFDLSELLRRVPGFHSIMPKRRKKYMKRR